MEPQPLGGDANESVLLRRKLLSPFVGYIVSAHYNFLQWQLINNEN
jgi:hypothetical protein